MDRVILGKATTNTTSSYYHRSGQQGLFISKPGANVHNCSDGDLMFDSTAPGLVQILGKGRASIPKQLYDKGIFGEVGAITENNWNTASTPLELSLLNRKTSWMFDAMSDVKQQTDTFATSSWDFKIWNQEFGADKVAQPGLMTSIFSGLYENALVADDGDEDGTAGLNQFYHPNERWSTLPPNDGSNRAGDGRVFPRYYALKLAESIKHVEKYFRFGDIDSDTYVRTLCKKLWRIQNVFPFYKNLPLNFDFKGRMGGSVRTKTNDLVQPDYYNWGLLNTNYMFGWLGSNQLTTVINRGERNVYEIFDNFKFFKLLDQYQLSTFTDEELREFISPEWKSAWSTYVTQNSGTPDSPSIVYYPSTTAYAGQQMNALNPKPWRAWSVPGQAQDEEQAKFIFFEYQFLLSWLYSNFGEYVNTRTPADQSQSFDSAGSKDYHGETYGPFDWSYNRQGKHELGGIMYTYDVPPQGADGYTDWETSEVSNDPPTYYPLFWSYQGLALPQLSSIQDGTLSVTTADVSPEAGNTVKNFTEYTSTGNWAYTEWKNGFVDVSTGVLPPSKDNKPVQIWWNFISRETGNNVTNLSFMNIRDNIAKESTASERQTSLKPGITSVSANTYVDDNDIRIRFEQPSTEDTADVFYTIFSENAFPDPAKDSIDALVLNITDVDDPNYPGDNYAGRRQIESTWWDGETRSDYGRYYSIVFPDDFVQTKGTATDPFRSHRNSDGVIRDALTITLNIPQGVVLSSNSHAKNIAFTDLEVDPAIGSVFGYSEVNRGSKKYGPPDPAGRHLLEKDAMVDPCIKLNLTSTEFTDLALRAMTIRIENNGTLVGGGGYGQYGQFNMPQVLKNFFKDYPGGGGGGGAGYHPPWRVENPETDWIGATTGTAASYLSAISDTSNTQPATDGTPHPDWVNHYEGVIDDHAQYSLRDERRILYPPTGAELVPGAARDAYFAHLNSLDTSSPATYEGEKDAHRAAIVNHWRGPNNYVEWGMGDVETVSNYGTGMDKITIDSLGPGKPGTGYLGSAPNQSGGTAGYNNVTGFPRWNLERAAGYGYFTTRPYYQGTILEMRDALGRYQKDLYHRIPGTYQLSFSSGTNFWIPRFGPMSIRGKEGTAGTTTSGGSGGIAGDTGVYGTSQDTFNQIGYIGLSALSGQPFGVGRPASGAGGSLVFVHANTTSTISGTSVTLINNEGAIMKSGGGGGSGGSSANGLRGGNLGRPGNWYTGPGAEADVQANSVSATTLGLPTVDTDPAWAWQTYTIRGEPGRLVWWSTSNVASSYSIVNKAKSVDGAVEGLDYNPGTKDWDYVSYLPDIDVTITRRQFIFDQGGRFIDIQVPWVTTGTKLWGRKLNDDGKVVWTKMNENTFEEYLNDINAVVTE